MYQSNAAMQFKVVDTTEKKTKPALKVVESEKAVRLRKNLEIIEQVLDGSFAVRHGRPKAEADSPR